MWMFRKEGWSVSLGEAKEVIVKQVINQRHSTRNFKENYRIAREVMEEILSAGLRAPSPKNRQPWQFIVLESPKKKNELADVMNQKLSMLEIERRSRGDESVSDLLSARITADIIRQASVLVVVCYQRDLRNHHDDVEWGMYTQQFEAADIQSIGAAIQNMLLQAEAMEIASLWICDVLYAHDEIMSFLNLKYPFVAAIAFGKAAPHQTVRKNIEEKTMWL